MNRLALAVLLSVGLTASAQAAFIDGGKCSASAQTGGISVANMTLNAANADDCYGLVNIGGDVTNEIGNINDIGWGTFSASNYIKDDVSGGVTATFLGMDWTLSAANGLNVGTYTLTVTDADPTNPPELPFDVDIVGFLKAGQPGAFYFFDGVTVDATNDGTFQIVWTVGQGNNPGLSGLSLFIGEPASTSNGGGGQAPEPGSLALLGVGALGAALSMRRRRNRA